MNNKISVSYLILSIVAFFFGCRGPVPATEENANNASASSLSLGQKYMVDTEGSVVTWKGSMLLESDEESIGYIYIAKGELMIEKGQLVGGTVIIDMNTIEYKDKTNKQGP